jgi:hypothetical protein
MSMNRKLNDTWLLVVVLVTGCAQWSSPPNSELAQLPLPKLAPDSVVLEVTFVRIPEERTDFDERFWPEVDESVFDPELRRHLDRNGFRCGELGFPPPTALQEVLDQQHPSELGDSVTTIQPGAEIVARSHRLRSRAGHPGKIVVRSNPIERVAALMYDEEGHVQGESFEQAQFYFSITSAPQGDGRVWLELTPMIEHGQPRSRFKGQQGAWIIDNTSRPAKVYDDLKVATFLAPGHSMAIGCSAAFRGLGEQFFAADPAEKTPRLLLVVRLQQTQMDDRFDQAEAIEPVATIAD